MDDLDKTILEYLESRDEDWTWVFGTRTLDKKTTIEMFKKNKKFRNLIKKEVQKLAIDLFAKATKR